MRKNPTIHVSVDSVRQLLAVIRGAKHATNAIRIYYDYTETIYYICAMDGFNTEMREEVLAKAAGLLQRNPPKVFSERLKGRFDIRQEIFREVAV